MKTCKTCKEDKVITEYYADKRAKSGFYSSCKACTGKAVHRFYRKKNKLPPPLSLEEKARRALEQKEKSNKYQVVYQNKRRDTHSWEQKARKTIFLLVREGVLVRSNNCAMCQKEDKLVGHHDDYNFLDRVRWICRSCHRNWHNANKAIYPTP